MLTHTRHAPASGTSGNGKAPSLPGLITGLLGCLLYHTDGTTCITLYYKFFLFASTLYVTISYFNCSSPFFAFLVLPPGTTTVLSVAANSTGGLGVAIDSPSSPPNDDVS